MLMCSPELPTLMSTLKASILVTFCASAVSQSAWSTSKELFQLRDTSTLRMAEEMLLKVAGATGQSLNVLLSIMKGAPIQATESLF